MVSYFWIPVIPSRKPRLIWASPHPRIMLIERPGLFGVASFETSLKLDVAYSVCPVKKNRTSLLAQYSHTLEVVLDI
jgi:hypothetical protein